MGKFFVHNVCYVFVVCVKMCKNAICVIILFKKKPVSHLWPFNTQSSHWVDSRWPPGKVVGSWPL